MNFQHILLFLLVLLAAGPELRAGGRQHPLRLQLDTRLESFQ